MATIDTSNVKKRYYLRYNGTASKWEIIYFRTSADAVAETSDRKFLSADEKTAITALQPSYQVILDQEHQSIIKLYSGDTISNGTKYYNGDLLVIDDNYLFIVRSTKQFGSGSSFNAQGAALDTVSDVESELLTLGVAAEYIGSFPTLSQYTSAINSKVDKTDILGIDNKILLTVLPDSILGQMVYGGTVSKGRGSQDNDFTTTLYLSGAAEKILKARSVSFDETNHKILMPTTANDIAKFEGMYFLVARGEDKTVVTSEAGVTPVTYEQITSFTYGSYTGDNSFQVGDWLIATNTDWTKIDNTDAVTSVNGHIGPVKIYRGTIHYNSTGYTEWPNHKGDIFRYTTANDETMYIVTEDFITTANSSSSGQDFYSDASSHIKPLGHGSASLNYAGVVQLTNSINSTNESNAATPKAVYNYAQYYKVYESGISNDPGSTNETKAIYNAEINGKEPQSTTTQDGTIWLLEKLPVTIS